MSNLSTFREEARSWLGANCPESMRGPGPVADSGTKVPIRNPEAQIWVDRCAARGWTVPLWPKAYGGAGLSTDEYLVLLDEMKRIRARSPLAGMGVGLIGPTLVEYGTQEQRARHLPRIANGKVRWCQGYSEPGAGSDLASLQTRAVDAGDHFVINGQKVWTSGADKADWMFCLVRTDPEAPKHEGISLLLLDMDQPGVTTKPIRLISGDSPFCETFFDNAVAQKDDLVGTLNRGWTVGKRLLQHERSGMQVLAGGSVAAPSAVETMRDLLARYGREPDHVDRLVRFDMRQRAFRLTQRRTVAESDDGRTPGAQTSIFELCQAELEKEETDLKARMLGTQGLGWEEDGYTREEIAYTRDWLSRKRRSIARGSNEIQMNIIAKRVLALPD